MKFKSVEHVVSELKRADYICSKTIATFVFLSQATGQTLMVDGGSSAI